MRVSRRLALALLAAAACGQAPSPEPPIAGQAREPAVRAVPEVEQLVAVVVERHPHDPAAYTQGLLLADGVLYESTGQYGISEVRRVDRVTGRPSLRQPTDPALFGEGIARVGERLIQLSWKSGVATVYDLATLAPIDQYSYSGEGWGLAYDPASDRLVMSNGTDRLVFRHPATFELVGEVRVTLRGRPLRFLNELEVVDGAVWANVWQQERIVRIDPATGQVTAWVDARGLLAPKERRGTDVLNGIAYDPQRGLFYLTGKLWPVLFAVRFEPAGS